MNEQINNNESMVGKTLTHLTREEKLDYARLVYAKHSTGMRLGDAMREANAPYSEASYHYYLNILNGKPPKPGRVATGTKKGRPPKQQQTQVVYHNARELMSQTSSTTMSLTIDNGKISVSGTPEDLANFYKRIQNGGMIR